MFSPKVRNVGPLKSAGDHSLWILKVTLTPESATPKDVTKKWIALNNLKKRTKLATHTMMSPLSSERLVINEQWPPQVKMMLQNRSESGNLSWKLMTSLYVGGTSCPVERKHIFFSKCLFFIWRKKMCFYKFMSCHMSYS